LSAPTARSGTPFESDPDEFIPRQHQPPFFRSLDAADVIAAAPDPPERCQKSPHNRQHSAASGNPKHRQSRSATFGRDNQSASGQTGNQTGINDVIESARAIGQHLTAAPRTRSGKVQHLIYKSASLPPHRSQFVLLLEYRQLKP